MNHGGYGLIQVENRACLAHRVAWADTHGPVPDGLCVCHHCDNPKCINVEHLFLGTRGENTADMVAKGRQRGAVGGRNFFAVLTDDQAQHIKIIVATGVVRRRAVAAAFGVSTATIDAIRTGRHWKHVAVPTGEQRHG